MSNTDPTKKPGMNSGASYKTPSVLLTYTTKAGTGHGSDRGKKYLREM